MSLLTNKLDTRYFKGLAGDYAFVLKFRLQKEGEEDYLVRSQSSHLMSRSVNSEITLKPGRYYVLMKITAYRHSGVESTEESVSRLASTRREKLVQIGLSYDLAHAKGIVETDKERKMREDCEKRRRFAERKKRREETRRNLQLEWIRGRKMDARKKRVADRLASSESRALRNEAPTYGTNEHLFHSRADAANQDFRAPEMNGTIPTVQLNGCNPLKRKRDSIDSRRPSIDTHFLTDSLDSSDLELLDGFEFDSDLDMPPEEPSMMEKIPRKASIGSEEPSGDPWNAVCVVGLRVYSKDPNLCLEVVRPVPEDDVEAALDMDDPAASATNEMGEWSNFGF